MSLKSLLATFPRERGIAFLLVAWIAFQVKGYFWVLLLASYLLIVKYKDTIVLSLAGVRQAILISLLGIFSFGLITSTTLDTGLVGLLGELPVTLPIVPIYLLAFAASRSDKKALPLSSGLISSLFVFGSATIINALFRGLLLHDFPASSLRPFEIQATSGCFLLAAITILLARLQTKDHIVPGSSIRLSLYTMFLAGIVFVSFKGVTSAASMLVCLAIFVVLTFLSSAKNGRRTLFMCIPLAVFASAVLLSFDARFFLLKYVLMPFTSPDTANGRMSLISLLFSDYSLDALPYIGPHVPVPSDFFAHNLILDSMIKDGLFPAASLLLFCCSVFFFLVSDFVKRPDHYRGLNVLLFIFMSLPALLQPVQFAHAFGFLLSIATVAILMGSSLGASNALLRAK